MNVQESPGQFQSSVEIYFATGVPDFRKSRRPRRINLVISFKDFLGETTVDSGEVTVRTNMGILAIPGTGLSGTEITIGDNDINTGYKGKLPVILDIGNEFGNFEIVALSKLGKGELEFVVPAPSGFALAEMLESVIYAFLVAIIIRIFFFQTFWIPSGSMEPTLYEGDRIVANKLLYRIRPPHRGEVVIFRVFQPPRRGVPGRLTFEEAYAVSEELGSRAFSRVNETGESGLPPVEVQDYIKRVVGLPGDVVEVVDGEILVNGEVLEEFFVTRPPDYNHYGPITVPPGEVFVLGDNRSNSQDSHVIGTIPVRNIEGRAEVVFWPVKRIGLIPQ